ncbi:MAG: DUF1385 domain-containing protein [Actinomycetota bacterium]|nr:DUF1385 domain-containing protein [Actinomycetota bacterium]
MEREEKIRLGGMALPNGVLVHGPTAWACAVRLPNGGLKVVAEQKRLRAANVTTPILRGAAKIVEVIALLPRVRRAVPEARLPFERPAVAASMVASAVVVRVVRDSTRLGPVARELVSGLLSVAPAALALRAGELAAYHGAEHVSIGTYEHGEPREKEHERCGSHLVGPILATTAVGNALASQAPLYLRGPARLASSVGALGAAAEIFSWMVRNPEHRLSKALARPGHELQHRFATAEPTPEQLEVANAALEACLDLERRGGSRG